MSTENKASLSMGLAAILCLAGASSAEPEDGNLYPLDPFLEDPDTTWHLTPSRFTREYGRRGFAWISQGAKKTAKAYRMPFSFADFLVVEALARFESDRLSEVTLYIFNRAELGEMPEEQFEQMIRETVGRLTAKAGSDPIRPEDDVRGMARLSSYVWRMPSIEMRLESSYTRGKSRLGFRYRAEYARVRLTPADTATSRPSFMVSGNRGAVGPVSLAKLRTHVERARGGDVFIEGIPMVYQGERGYCAVATAERVMRHYGGSVDQHELAQLALSSAAKGTSPTVLHEVLTDVGARIGCRIRVLYAFDMKELQSIVRDYNRVASRRDAPRYELPEHQIIMLDQVYRELDAGVLREARQRQRGDYLRVQSSIKKSIDKGVPLAWSLMLGKVDETPPVRGFGGHMRLIIGYNTEKEELLYSDTWGPGHEIKRMLLEDAWAVTTGLFVIEPRKTTR